MTDELAPTIDGKPLDAEDPNKGIQVDSNGDPVRQGTLMLEKESYERIIEGLKISSDAAAHLVKQEPEAAPQWRLMARNLDAARKICVQHAGIGLTMKEKDTSAVRGEAMAWKMARDRFREGLIQAAGGCRQLATCFRADFWWSGMATNLENIERKVRNKKMSLAQPERGRIILPPTYN